jgi:hypothetical protein
VRSDESVLAEPLRAVNFQTNVHLRRRLGAEYAMSADQVYCTHPSSLNTSSYLHDVQEQLLAVLKRRLLFPVCRRTESLFKAFLAPHPNTMDSNIGLKTSRIHRDCRF